MMVSLQIYCEQMLVPRRLFRLSVERDMVERVLVETHLRLRCLHWDGLGGVISLREPM